MSTKTPANSTLAIHDSFSIAGGTPSSTTVELTGSDQPASTRRTLINKFNSYFLPVALAGAFLAPADRTAFERITFSSASPIRHFGRYDYWAEEDAWTYVPELVTLEQVEALNALFSLPAPPELPSFILDED